MMEAIPRKDSTRAFQTWTGHLFLQCQRRPEHTPNVLKDVRAVQWDTHAKDIIALQATVEEAIIESFGSNDRATCH